MKRIYIILLIFCGIFAFAGTSWILLNKLKSTEFVEKVDIASLKLTTKSMPSLPEKMPVAQRYKEVIETIKPGKQVEPKKIKQVREEIKKLPVQEKKEIYALTDQKLKQFEQDIIDDIEQGGEHITEYAHHFNEFRPMFDDMSMQPYDDPDLGQYADYIRDDVGNIDDRFKDYGYQPSYDYYQPSYGYDEPVSHQQPSLSRPSIAPVTTWGTKTTYPAKKTESKPTVVREKQSTKERTPRKPQKEFLKPEPEESDEEQELVPFLPTKPFIPSTPSALKKTEQESTKNALNQGANLVKALEALFNHAQKINNTYMKLLTSEVDAVTTLVPLAKQSKDLEDRKKLTSASQEISTIDQALTKTATALVQKQSEIQTNINTLIANLAKEQNEQLILFKNIANAMKDMRNQVKKEDPQQLLEDVEDPHALEELKYAYQANYIEPVTTLVQVINQKVDQDLALLELHAQYPFLPPEFITYLESLYKHYQSIVQDADAMLLQFSQSKTSNALVKAAIDPQVIQNVAQKVEKVVQTLALLKATKQKKKQAQPITNIFAKKATQLLQEFKNTAVKAIENAEKRANIMQQADLLLIAEKTKSLLDHLREIGIEEHIAKGSIQLPVAFAEQYLADFVQFMIPMIFVTHQSVRLMLEQLQKGTLDGATMQEAAALSSQIVNQCLQITMLFNQIPVQQNKVDLKMPDEELNQFKGILKELIIITILVVKIAGAQEKERAVQIEEVEKVLNKTVATIGQAITSIAEDNQKLIYQEGPNEPPQGAIPYLLSYTQAAQEVQDALNQKVSNLEASMGAERGRIAATHGLAIVSSQTKNIEMQLAQVNAAQQELAAQTQAEIAVKMDDILKMQVHKSAMWQKVSEQFDTVIAALRNHPLAIIPAQKTQQLTLATNFKERFYDPILQPLLTGAIQEEIAIDLAVLMNPKLVKTPAYLATMREKYYSIHAIVDVGNKIMLTFNKLMPQDKALVNPQEQKEHEQLREQLAVVMHVIMQLEQGKEATLPEKKEGGWLPWVQQAVKGIGKTVKQMFTGDTAPKKESSVSIVELSEEEVKRLSKQKMARVEEDIRKVIGIKDEPEQLLLTAPEVPEISKSSEEKSTPLIIPELPEFTLPPEKAKPEVRELTQEEQDMAELGEQVAAEIEESKSATAPEQQSIVSKSSFISRSSPSQARSVPQPVQGVEKPQTIKQEPSLKERAQIFLDKTRDRLKKFNNDVRAIWKTEDNKPISQDQLKNITALFQQFFAYLDTPEHRQYLLEDIEPSDVYVAQYEALMNYINHVTKAIEQRIIEEQKSLDEQTKAKTISLSRWVMEAQNCINALHSVARILEQANQDVFNNTRTKLDNFKVQLEEKLKSASKK